MPTVRRGVALQEGVLVMEEEDSSASNPLANPMMDPMNMVYAFHRRYVVGSIDFYDHAHTTHDLFLLLLLQRVCVHCAGT